MKTIYVCVLLFVATVTEAFPLKIPPELDFKTVEIQIQGPAKDSILLSTSSKSDKQEFAVGYVWESNVVSARSASDVAFYQWIHGLNDQMAALRNQMGKFPDSCRNYIRVTKQRADTKATTEVRCLGIQDSKISQQWDAWYRDLKRFATSS